ncbi:putative Zinc finger protein 768 [Hypsibius exemplaris]|uniref:Zinc finger protein 768 n=1 Tax=Hypsibius exemplaris TaxID=2072580 RepID=A0A1W0WMG1_HYPEX|nr:putative Zinc finger protein 768 [Hypsibius exemplaris]
MAIDVERAVDLLHCEPWQLFLMEKSHIHILRSNGVAYGSRCEKCNTSTTFKRGSLPCSSLHAVTVPDLPAARRAVAGLPQQLKLCKLPSEEDGSGWKVCAKTAIAEATVFGPISGAVTDFNNDPGGFAKWMLDNLKDALRSCYGLVGDSCNWMKFVRVAETAVAENLVAFERTGQIFFMTIERIASGEELRLRYLDTCPATVSRISSAGVYTEPSSSRSGISTSDAPATAVIETEATDTGNGPRRSLRKKRNLPIVSDFVVSAPMQKRRTKSLPEAALEVEASCEPSISVRQAEPGQQTGTADVQSAQNELIVENDPSPQRNLHSVKRQSHMQHIEAKLQLIIDINPYQFAEWQASYGLWKLAFERLVATGLLLDQTEGPHRLKSLINRQIDAYKTKLERHVQQNCTDITLPSSPKEHLLQRLLDLQVSAAEEWDFSCEECRVDFIRGDLLLLHQRFKHGPAEEETEAERETACLACGAQHETVLDLADHVEKHGRPSAAVKAAIDFPCPKCKQRFGKDKYLIRHLARMHPEGEELFKCPECPRGFDSLAAMRKHNTRCHGSKKTMECAVCLEKLPDLVAQQAHMETHRAEDGTFPCPYCVGKTYGDFKLLRKHIRTNHGKDSFPCPVCGKVFKRMTALVVHEVVHLASFAHECRKCGRKFKRREKLLDHEKRLHKSHREYKFKDRSESIARSFANAKICAFCTKQYASAQRLLQHQRLRHPEQYKYVSERIVVGQVMGSDDGGLHVEVQEVDVASSGSGVADNNEEPEHYASPVGDAGGEANAEVAAVTDNHQFEEIGDTEANDARPELNRPVAGQA